VNFTKQLLIWYAENKRDLPWRDTKDPYLIWLSEVILQQTRVDQGMGYYLRFSQQFPTVQHLANANEQDVLKLWQGLGYYSRARNLHTAARQIAERFQGQFPETTDELLSLKGVGEYTAAAVASIAFETPAAAIDGNVLRVMSRVAGIHDPINATSGKNQVKQAVTERFSTLHPGAFNQAMMELGALVCLPRNPKCKECPVAAECVAFASDAQHLLPVKNKSKAVKNRYFLFVVPVWQRATWMRQRATGDIWAGLYEFPLIETEAELNLREQERLIGNLLGTAFTVQKEWHKKHVLSHQHIHARFVAAVPSEKPALQAYQQYPLSEVGNLAVSRLTDLFLEHWLSDKS
jgi:A/G-specific adenine glycosylase